MKTNQNESELRKCNDRFKELEGSIAAAFNEIGKKFYEDNKENRLSGSMYQELVDSVTAMYEEQYMIEKKILALQDMRKCTECGNILSLDSVFCNKCGARLEELPQEIFGGNAEQTMQTSPICAVCGAPLENDAVFCSVCGAKVKADMM